MIMSPGLEARHVTQDEILNKHQSELSPIGLPFLRSGLAGHSSSLAPDRGNPLPLSLKTTETLNLEKQGRGLTTKRQQVSGPATRVMTSVLAMLAHLKPRFSNPGASGPVSILVAVVGL